MPKIIGTRKQKAADLLYRLEHGPSFGEPGQSFTPQLASEAYQRWVNSWVLEQVKELIPELRKAS